MIGNLFRSYTDRRSPNPSSLFLSHLSSHRTNTDFKLVPSPVRHSTHSTRSILLLSWHFFPTDGRTENADDGDLAGPDDDDNDACVRPSASVRGSASCLRPSVDFNRRSRRRSPFGESCSTATSDAADAAAGPSQETGSAHMIMMTPDSQCYEQAAILISKLHCMML